MIKRIFTLFISIILVINLFTVSLVADEDTDTKEKFDISAENGIIIDLETKNAIFEKDADSEVFCGFLPRLMTCILLVESGVDLKTEITVSSKTSSLVAQPGAVTLKSGDKVSLNDLLVAVLIGNSQEAAAAIGLYMTDDKISNFINTMNERAKELGAENTYFANCTGYYNTQSLSYTTVRDAAIITMRAISLDYIVDKSNTIRGVIKVNDKDNALFTRNYLVDPNSRQYDKKASGIAFHGDTRIGSSVSSMTKGDNSGFLAIAVSSKAITSSFDDVSSMLNFALTEYSYQTLIKANTPVLEIKVNYGKGRDHVALITETNVDAALTSNVSAEDIINAQVVQAPSEVNAPIEKGQVLGSITLEYEGVIYGSVNLIAQTSVEMDAISEYTEKITAFFANPIFWIVVAIIIIVTAFYVLLTFLLNRKKIKDKKVKKRDRVNFK